MGFGEFCISRSGIPSSMMSLSYQEKYFLHVIWYVLN